MNGPIAEKNNRISLVVRELKSLVIFFIVILAIYFLFRTSPFYSKFNVADLKVVLGNIGNWAVPVFLFSFIFLPLFIFPVSPLCMVSGVLFGFFTGFLLSAVGYMLNAWIAFLLTRGMFRAKIDRLVSGRGLVVDKKLADHGILASFLIRFVPVSPFGFQNYVAGLSGVSLVQYTGGTMLGGLPWVAVFVYMGDSLLRPGSREFIISVSVWLFFFLISLIILLVSKNRFFG